MKSRARDWQPVVERPPHSSGDALADCLFSAVEYSLAPRRARCGAGFHRGLLIYNLPMPVEALHRSGGSRSWLGAVSLLVLSLGCSPSVDVPSALRVTDVRSGWFDAGVDSLGRNKLVPTVSFRLENLTADTLQYLQLNGVFRRRNETEEWGDAFVGAVGREGLDAGQRTGVLRLESGRGYTGEQPRAEMLAHRDFVDVTMDLFVKHRGDQWVRLDTVAVDRQLLAR